MTREELVGGGLLSVAEAARFLGLGRSKLYALMDSGRLVYVKIDGARRVPKLAAVALAAGHLVFRGGGDRD